MDLPWPYLLDANCDSMDAEFSHMEDLSGELEHFVQSMYSSSRNAAKANRIAFEARDIASHSNEVVEQLEESITVDISSFYANLHSN